MTKAEIIKQIEDKRERYNTDADKKCAEFVKADNRILELFSDTNLVASNASMYGNCDSYDEFLELFKKIKKIDKTAKVDTYHATCLNSVRIDCISESIGFQLVVNGDQDETIKRVSNGKCHLEDRQEKSVVCSM